MRQSANVVADFVAKEALNIRHNVLMYFIDQVKLELVCQNDVIPIE